MAIIPISVMQTSFTGGEWSPSLYARTKLAKYYTALRTALNTVIHPHGPISNRPGLIFVGETKYSSKVSRMIPFKFSVVQTYTLEFGEYYMRVYKDGGRVVEADVTISGATQADPVVITATSHGYSNGDWVIISVVGGMTELNGKTFVVANATTHTFSLKDVDGNDIDGTGFTAYISGGVVNKIYEIATPYAEADLALLKYTQSADVLILNHPSYQERQLTRSGHTAWTIVASTFASSVAAPGNFIRSVGSGAGHTYGVTAVTEDEGEESLISSSATGGEDDTFTWDAVSGADYYNFYEEVNGIYGWLGSAGSNSFVVPSALDPDMEATPPKNRDPFSGANNYPAVSTFYEQRLLRSRTNNAPQTVRGSVTGAFYNMNVSSPAKDTDAWAFTLNATQVNEIRWMAPLRVLILGTSGGIWQMSAGSAGSAITYNNVDVVKQNETGVSNLLPLFVGNSILFVGTEGSKVRDLFYTLEEDGYKGNDLSILATHLFEGYSVPEWCYQRSPDSIIWAIRNDGTLLGLTYYREHEVWGWHRHETQGLFESVASITTDAGVDEVYVIVKRTINGVTRRYVELMSQRLVGDEIQDAFFVDSGLTLDNPITISGATQADPVVITANDHGFSNDDLVDIADIVGMTELNVNRYTVANVTTHTFSLKNLSGTEDIDGTAFSTYVSGGTVRKVVTVISGFDHLENMELAVLANGSVVNNLVVSNGSITLPNGASRVHGGLGYVSDIETMDFEFPTETGPTVQDKRRDIKSVLLRLENTRAVWVGPSEDRLDEVPFRSDEDYGDPTRLYSGDKEVFIDSGDERESRIFIRNVDPLPITITAIIARIEYGDS